MRVHSNSCYHLLMLATVILHMDFLCVGSFVNNDFQILVKLRINMALSLTIYSDTGTSGVQ